MVCLLCTNTFGNASIHVLSLSLCVLVLVSNQCRTSLNSEIMGKAMGKPQSFPRTIMAIQFSEGRKCGEPGFLVSWRNIVLKREEESINILGGKKKKWSNLFIKSSVHIIIGCFVLHLKVGIKVQYLSFTSLLCFSLWTVYRKNFKECLVVGIPTLQQYLPHCPKEGRFIKYWWQCSWGLCNFCPGPMCKHMGTPY